MKKIMNIILSILIILNIVDAFIDIPYIYGSIGGVISCIIALFMLNKAY